MEITPLMDSDMAWCTKFFQRINELRNDLSSQIRGNFIFSTTSDFAPVFLSFAPDFWSIRSDEFHVHVDTLEMPAWHHEIFSSLLMRFNRILSSSSEESFHAPPSALSEDQKREILWTSRDRWKMLGKHGDHSYLELGEALFLHDIFLRLGVSNLSELYLFFNGHLDVILESALNEPALEKNMAPIFVHLLQASYVAAHRAELPARFWLPAHVRIDIEPKPGGEPLVDELAWSSWGFLQRHRAEFFTLLGRLNDAQENVSRLRVALERLQAFAGTEQLREWLGAGILGLA